MVLTLSNCVLFALFLESVNVAQFLQANSLFVLFASGTAVTVFTAVIVP